MPFSDSMLKIEKEGGFEPFEFLQLLLESALSMRHFLDCTLQEISTIKWREDAEEKTFHYERFLEAVIEPFQRRAKRLWKGSNRACCVAACSQESKFHTGGLGFCEDHKWVYETHRDRHDSMSDRLPVLLLVWDNTPYHHAYAGSGDIELGFHDLIEQERNRYEITKEKILSVKDSIPLEILEDLERNEPFHETAYRNAWTRKGFCSNPLDFIDETYYTCWKIWLEDSMEYPQEYDEYYENYPEEYYENYPEEYYKSYPEEYHEGYPCEEWQQSNSTSYWVEWEPDVDNGWS